MLWAFKKGHENIESPRRAAIAPSSITQRMMVLRETVSLVSRTTAVGSTSATIRGITDTLRRVDISVAAARDRSAQPRPTGRHGAHAALSIQGRSSTRFILFIHTVLLHPHIMLCTVTRTHHLGVKRHDRDPGPALTGTVRMYSIMRDDMKRYIRVMTMDGLQKFGAADKGAIPDLLQPELLTFSSDRGMMVCGFEEIDGRRYYQGWWMRWIQS